MLYFSKLIIAALSFFLVVLLVLLWRRTNRPLALREEQFSLDEIYAIHFAEFDVDFPDFLLLWEDIADIFCVVPETIRPSDRFGIELPWRTVFGSNDEDILLFSKYLERANQRGLKDEALLPELNSVRDYILSLSRLKIKGAI